MMKILVLGSTGMAGHVITTYLEQNREFEVFNLSHRRKFNDRTVVMDVSNINHFNRYLDSVEIDVIINCIGVLNRFAEENKDKAALLNGYLPHFLEYKYRSADTKIIHLSTDCVFSGKTGDYTENSFRDGDSFYDRTKAIGEVENEKDLTFRMSIIGPDLSCEGIGLFNWFMKTGGNINGYANSIWNGITTIELAKAIEAAIFSGLSGLYHLVPENSITKYELVNLFKNVFNRQDVTINKYENPHINKRLINTRKDFNYKVPSYDEMLNEMKDWIVRHKEFYPHYPVT